MTIQDQLRSLTPPTSLDSDWDDVVARANRRARKQHFQSRAAIGLFVVVVAAGALLFPSSGVDTIDAPAAGITAELDRLETFEINRSTLHLVTVAFISWGLSLLIAAITFFATPSVFRAPFLPMRISRIVGAVLRGTSWTGGLCAVTGVVLIWWENLWLQDIHKQSSWGFLIGLALVVLVLSSQSESALFGALYVVLLSPALSLTLVGFQNSGRSLAAEQWSAFVVHAGVAVLLAWVMLRIASKIETPVDNARLHPGTFRDLSWRKVTAAFMMIGGACFAILSIAPALLVHQELQDVLPEVEGLTRTVDTSNSNPLFDRDIAALPVTIRYAPTEPSEFEPNDVRFGSDLIRVRVDALLLPLGFVKVDQTFDGDPRDVSEIFRRARNDEYGAVVVTSSDSQFVTSLSVKIEDSSSLENGRVGLRVGVVIALSGLILLWSETAISRYQHGKFAVPRHGRGRERLGWLVIVTTVIGVLVWILGGTANLIGVVLVIAIGWYLGARLLVPDVRAAAQAATATTEQ